jgi:DNA primase catalytic subunit
MDNNFSNYDMLDKMIANNKKAKSWTVFWILLLCLMAAAVLWLAHTVSEKNKAISQKDEVITATTLSLEQKSRIIDSLTENCNDDKSEIIKSYDSVITQTEVALDIVNSETQSGVNKKLTPLEKEKLKKANTSINNVKSNLTKVKAEIKKNNTRLFIQFNEQKNTGLVNRLQAILEDKSNYIIAPPEYINGSFGTVIKFYNYQNTDEENLLKSFLTKYFGIPAKSIAVKYEKNVKIKPTVEVWIGTRPVQIKTLQMKQTN